MQTALLSQLSKWGHVQDSALMITLAWEREQCNINITQACSFLCMSEDQKILLGARSRAGKLLETWNPC